MLIKCPNVVSLWQDVQDWINSIGLPDYTISERKIASGELEKSLRINRFIPLNKKVIYDSM